MIRPVREARAGQADRPPLPASIVARGVHLLPSIAEEFSYTAFSCRRQTSYPRFVVHDMRAMDRLGGFADDFNDRALIACASSARCCGSSYPIPPSGAPLKRHQPRPITRGG